ncbi:hypothetical protein D3C78_949670 [compost metagenome]
MIEQADGFHADEQLVVQRLDFLGRHLRQAAVLLQAIADAAQLGSQRRQQVGADDLAALVVAQRLFRILRRRLRSHAAQLLLGVAHHGQQVAGLLHRLRAVEGEGQRGGGDQDQHDQADALLPVVGAVGEGHPGAGEDQQSANPPGRRRASFRGAEQRAVANRQAQRQQQQGGAGETHQRREEQCVANLDQLRPGRAADAEMAVHGAVRQADADDRADQRVR